MIVLFGRAPAQAGESVPTQTQQQHLSCFISTRRPSACAGSGYPLQSFACPKNKRPTTSPPTHPTPPTTSNPPQAKGFPLISLTQPTALCNHKPPTTNYKLCRS
ncbi:MAG: hypothetical protein LBQ31_11520, partial [Bacteroidales bacterium]|nr:hypothetical protein [Bacteroidales bacterium]